MPLNLRSNLRRLKTRFRRASWRLFAIGGIYKTRQLNFEMLALMPRGGRRPTYLVHHHHSSLLK